VYSFRPLTKNNRGLIVLCPWDFEEGENVSARLIQIKMQNNVNSFGEL
jgi:hypothetical protein